MENVRSNSPKLLNSFAGTINKFTGFDPYSPTYSLFDPYASPDGSTSFEAVDSTIIKNLVRTRSTVAAVARDPFADISNYLPPLGHKKYHGSSVISSGGSFNRVSPLSGVEDLETPPSRLQSVFNTPVKVEEDVLVMDGILVGSSFSNGKFIHKKELCRPWEDSATSIQCAQRKQELPQSRSSRKSKLEAKASKTYGGSGSSHHGSRGRVLHHEPLSEPSPGTGSGPNQKTSTLMNYTRNKKPSKLPVTTTYQKTPPGKFNNQSSPTMTAPNRDWSPVDDGIEIALPSVSSKKAPTRDEVNTYINNVLYGSVRRRRLPVFSAICPE